MNLMDSIFEKAKKAARKVAFPEATEEKILKAAAACVESGICIPVLVGSCEKIKQAAEEYSVCTDGIGVIDSTDSAWLEALIERYTLIHPENSAKTMKRKAKDPLYTALMLEAMGEVDCTFAGMSHTTGEVALAGQMVIGLQEGVKTVSSMGVFDIPGYEGCEGQLLGFGDSALCTCPSEEDLADIAIAACNTAQRLLGWEPRCALLSFSTDGSAEHEMVEKIRRAVAIAHEKRPELKIDGEFQLDAAINPKVAAKKVKRPSPVAGKANIIIWPDLNVGNIGVKLVQQFAGADAYGPLLQGFAMPVSDCSRSAPISELLGNIAMTAVMAGE